MDYVYNPNEGTFLQDNASNNPPFWCQYCDQIFPSQEILKIHVETFHAVGQDSVPCKTCGETFFSDEHLANHSQFCFPQQLPNYDSQFSCHLCQNWFQTEAQLKDHQKTHETVTMYQCEKCNLVFRYEEVENHSKSCFTGKIFD